MVIGGESIYQLFFPLATKLYLTLVDTEIEGDAYFPVWQAEEWEEVARIEHGADDKHVYNYSFIIFCRNHKL
jgi:dihydrofolate reductase